MTQKLLLVAFFALIVGIISVPVPCASGTGVLEVGETLSVDSLSVHCPPNLFVHVDLLFILMCVNYQDIVHGVQNGTTIVKEKIQVFFLI